MGIYHGEASQSMRKEKRKKREETGEKRPLPPRGLCMLPCCWWPAPEVKLCLPLFSGIRQVILQLQLIPITEL